MSSARELAAEARAALERAKAMERDPFSGGNHPVQDEDLYSMRERTRRRHDAIMARYIEANVLAIAAQAELTG